MAYIFISFAREDEATVQRLAAALQDCGWSVFWDREMPIGGRFDQHLAGELRAARCVVVLWSEHSINAEWVIEEAADARNREVLAPVRLQDVAPPFGFAHRNYADLFGWTAGRKHPGFDKLVERITALVGPPATAAEVPPAYLGWLRRTYTNVTLLGQDADKSHSFQLDHVYVPALTPAAPRADSAGGEKRRETEERRLVPLLGRLVPLLERVDEESLYVLAQAGSGKSTFCRWAVLRSIAGEELCHPVPAPKEFAEPEPKRLRGRLPVLVPFREFAPRTDWGRGDQRWQRSDLERALAAWLGKSIEDLPGAVLIAHLKAGTAFLLLDGLDELAELEMRDGVTVYPRELVSSGLADALPRWLKAGNRVLLTSRPVGMERAGLNRLGLEQAPLEPLPEALQELFVRRWFHTLRREEQAEGLIETIGHREELAPLVENPMLLTALCILYDSGGHLPEDRYRLCKRIVDNVLFHRFPGGARQTEPVKARLEGIALRMHAGDAAEPRTSPVAEVSELEVDQVLRDIADEGWCEEDRRVKPAIRRNELLDKSGLLLPRPNQQVAFYHLSFQEYLAAERILRFSDDLDAVIRERSTVPEWRPTLLFLFAGKAEGARPDWGSRLLGRLIETQSRQTLKANPAPAVFIAEALDLILAKKRPVPSPVRDAFVHLVLDAIEDEIALPARHAIALTLGRLGDPRISGLRHPGAYVEVPAGRLFAVAGPNVRGILTRQRVPGDGDAGLAKAEHVAVGLRDAPALGRVIPDAFDIRNRPRPKAELPHQPGNA